MKITKSKLRQSIKEAFKKVLNRSDQIDRATNPHKLKVYKGKKKKSWEEPGFSEAGFEAAKKSRSSLPTWHGVDEELDVPRMKDAPPGNVWDNPFRIPPEERTGKPMEASSGPPHVQGIRVMQNEYDKWVEAAKDLPDDPRNDIRGFERRTIDAFINTVNSWRKQRSEEPNFSCSDVEAAAEQPEEQPIEEGLRRKKIKINLTRGEG